MEDYDDSDRSALGDEGCLFPDRCCMPGEHYTSECHTPEDFEAMMTEATLWALLIPGPDDVWAMPSREAADEAARKHNELVDRDDWPFPDLRESSRAKVIEWPYDAASHAEALANDEPETLSSNDLGIPDGAAEALGPTHWMPLPAPPIGRCIPCRETGALHCHDPLHCGGPWSEAPQNAEVTGGPLAARPVD